MYYPFAVSFQVMVSSVYVVISVSLTKFKSEMNSSRWIAVMPLLMLRSCIQVSFVKAAATVLFFFLDMARGAVPCPLVTGHESRQSARSSFFHITHYNCGASGEEEMVSVITGCRGADPCLVC